MNTTNDHLPLKPILIMIVLSAIWGANWAVVKLSAGEIAPIFMAGLRSAIAAVCLYFWVKAKGLRIFPSGTIAFHGLVSGLLFGTEFALVYFGLMETLASRVYVLLYSAPFWAALFAHFFLNDDRLNAAKLFGLSLAFVGVFVLFAHEFGSLSRKTLIGDAMVILAGAVWAGSTIYMKKYLAGRVHPSQTMFYFAFFSMPLLFGLSLPLESPLIHNLSWFGVGSVLFQGIIVAFLSYLAWTDLIHKYPASLIHAFSFFTPVFGVIISGLIILGEPVSLNLVCALVLVSVGTVLVNRPARSR